MFRNATSFSPTVRCLLREWPYSLRPHHLLGQGVRACPFPSKKNDSIKRHVENMVVRRVMVGTDRSETADQAVRWAASLAERCGAELIVVQIIVSQSPAVTEYGAAEHTRAIAAGEELAIYARR